MKNYELVEHTADIGIRIRGSDLNELFKNAALATFDIIAEQKTENRRQKTETKEYVIKQSADNLEELFINWLNELLSLSATKELIFSEFKINKLDKNNLEAQATGRDNRDYRINVEIKAATYHNLKLKQVDSGWLAEVIFDV